jgi:hypothetical protein
MMLRSFCPAVKQFDGWNGSSSGGAGEGALTIAALTCTSRLTPRLGRPAGFGHFAAGSERWPECVSSQIGEVPVPSLSRPFLALA